MRPLSDSDTLMRGIVKAGSGCTGYPVSDGRGKTVDPKWLDPARRTKNVSSWRCASTLVIRFPSHSGVVEKESNGHTSLYFYLFCPYGYNSHWLFYREQTHTSAMHKKVLTSPFSHGRKTPLGGSARTKKGTAALG